MTLSSSCREPWATHHERSPNFGTAPPTLAEATVASEIRTTALVSVRAVRLRQHLWGLRAVHSRELGMRRADPRCVHGASEQRRTKSSVSRNRGDLRARWRCGGCPASWWESQCIPRGRIFLQETRRRTAYTNAEPRTNTQPRAPNVALHLPGALPPFCPKVPVLPSAFPAQVPARTSPDVRDPRIVFVAHTETGTSHG